MTDLSKKKKSGQLPQEDAGIMQVSSVISFIKPLLTPCL